MASISPCRTILNTEAPFEGFDYLSQTREILAILSEEVASPGLINHWVPLLGTAQVSAFWRINAPK
jgi:hypothetical protein